MKTRLLISALIIATFVTASVVDADVSARLRALRSESGASEKEVTSFAKAETSRARVYRSSIALRKIVIPSTDKEAVEQARSAGAIEVGAYDSFKLFVIEQSRFEQANDALRLAASKTESAVAASNRLIVRDDFNTLLLRSGAIDTTDEDAPGTFVGLGRATGFNSAGVKKRRDQTSESPLRLVQFIGPVKPEWLDSLRSNGMEIIAYVPNNAYLVRGGAGASEHMIASAMRDYARGRGVIQWEGPFTPENKIHPVLASQMTRKSKGEVQVAIQIAGDGGEDLASAKAMASSLIGNAYNVMNFTNLKMRVDLSRLNEIAALESVVNIEPWTEPRLWDERANQIVVDDLIEAGKRPRAPGYMGWLNARSLNANLNFAIDVTDTGIDRGSTLAANLHPDFLDANGQSRVVYARDYTTDLDPSDIGGHGTLNLSVAGGSNFGSQPGLNDADGFRYGLGIAPFVKLGSSKIFQASGRFSISDPFSKIISDAYNDGARISSNSWGSGTNEYTLEAQEYDARVRDALPSQPGNQEMAIIFAAGNSGPNRFISSPGTGKNVVTVGASESFRAGGDDGCLVKNEDADSAQDMAFFSSGGPLNEGRYKPDLVAPGTHIQGAASQRLDFDASTVCGNEKSDELYFPLNQTLYTWSSGTSHSTPQVAGAAALARQFFLNRGQEPSAALIRAFLVNTTTYLTGAGAGGNLPHPAQGWGLLNLGRLFDNAPKVFVDQRDNFTASGQEFVLTGEVTDASIPFRATLSWTDAPGLSAFAPWVNDLDLEITINGQVYRGNNLVGQESKPGGEPDTRNNTEAIWLPTGVTGPFVIRVRASNITGDGVPGNASFTDQDFALVIYNAVRKETAVPVFSGTTVSGGGNDVADPGETVSMRVRLGGASPVALNGARGTVTTTTPGVIVTTNTADFPNIASGATGESLTAFAFTINSSFVCGGDINFVIDVTSGGSTAKIPFVVRTGRAEILEKFSDDIESGQDGWVHGSLIKKKKKRVDTWTLSTRRFRSGTTAWFTPNPSKLTDSNLDILPLSLPANGRDLQLVFYHTFEVELSFDGGVIEISTDGKTFTDLGDKILEGQYNGTLRSTFTNNPLAGRKAWTGGRFGTFQKVVVDLSSFAGKSITIRFRFGSDDSVAASGWYIDDVRVGGELVTCSAP